MKVQDVMTKNPIAIKETEFLTRARQIMRDYHYRTLPVVNGNNRVKGILTETALLGITSTKSNVTVEGFMRPAPTVTPDMELSHSAKLMLDAVVGRVPVVKSTQDSSLSGILSIVDIFRHIDLAKIPHKTVSEVMTRDVKTCSAADRIATVWSNMAKLGYSGIPVVKNGKLVGMVTRRDIIKAGYARIEVEAAHGTRAGTSLTVDKIMKTPPYTIAPDATIMEAIKTILKLDVGRLSVVDGSRLVGIVDRYDLIKACL